MLDHVALQCADVEAAEAFYLEVFQPLGFRVEMSFDREEGRVVGIAGHDGFPRLWLGPLVDAGHRPIHLAFNAIDRDAVDAVGALALDRGATVLHPPRLWPEYHPAYYGVFLRDLDGNNVEAVTHQGLPT